MVKVTKISAISGMALAALLGPFASAWADFGDTDTTFGTSATVPGFTITDLGGNADDGQDIVTGIADRIYTFGARQTTGADTMTVVISRFTKDGALDPTFAAGGKLEINGLSPPIDDYYFEVQDAESPANGRIFIGVAACDDTACEAQVARLRFNGALDDTYGDEGIASFLISANNSTVNQLMLVNGNLLVLVQHATAAGNRTIVARLTPEGELDPEFGTGGRVDVSVGGCDVGPFMTVGRPTLWFYVTAATRATCTSAPTPSLTRVGAEGRLDPEFGTGGHVVGNFGFADDIVGLVAQDQLGAGIAYAIGNVQGDVLNVDIIPLNDDGTRDSSKAVESGSYDPPAAFDNRGGSVFQTDGKMVLNGRYQTSATNTDQAITRIEGSPSLAHAPRFAADIEANRPFVGFVNPATSVAETGGSTTVTVTLTRATTEQVTVPFTLGGSATRTIDYNVSASQFVIAPGARTDSITITILDDAVEEADEAILLTLGTPENAQPTATHNTFIVNIEDDDLRVNPAPPRTGDGGALDWLLLTGLLGLASRRLRRR
jgi:uncharacterized delta-60 repeat protein